MFKEWLEIIRRLIRRIVQGLLEIIVLVGFKRMVRVFL